jgi:hypothetical protein
MVGRGERSADAPYFYDDQVTRLQVLLEEVTRARPGSPDSRFVSPDRETFDRLKSRFHHVLFGRRGTGKSSLLRRIESEHRADGHLVAWADQETFMGLSYPDVLVSTLEEVFLQFSRQLRTSSPRLMKRWFRRRSPGPSEHELVAGELERAVAQLMELKLAPNETDIEWTATFASHRERDDSRETSVGLERGPIRGGRSRKGASSQSSSTGAEASQRYRTTKAEHLERAVPTYRRLMKAATATMPDAFLILDDFYRLAEADQPKIAGYFHRVVKDTGVWLKFGSIRYWTRLYSGGSPAIGMEIPHDLKELSLDRGLLARTFR